MRKIKTFLILILVILAVVLLLRFFPSDSSNSKFSSLTSNITSSIINEDKDESSELNEVTVVSVVDGDTIWVLKDGIRTKVRFIGVDTPESVSSNSSKNCEEGEEASKYTKSRLTENMTIWLQYDITSTDKYGRDLAYIWLSNDVNTSSEEDIKNYMYNAELLEKGYAHCMAISPNTSNSKLFSEIESESKDNSNGFWAENFWD